MGKMMVVPLGGRRQVHVDAPFYSSSEDETLAWGMDLGGRLPAGTVVGLVGGLGAGKTVLAGALLHGAGLDPSIPVTSPSFTLMNHYPGRVRYVHVDLYRIAHAKDAFHAGIEEVLLDPGEGYVVVEWFENFTEIWPPSYLRLDIHIAAPYKRVIHAGGPGG